MQINELRIRISEVINIGNYENINPQVELSATLELYDDPKVCFDELHKQAVKLWSSAVERELKWVRERRQADSIKLHQLKENTKGIEAQQSYIEQRV